MQIIFESRDTYGSQIKETSVDRVRFVLRRLSMLVSSTKVQFSDINGPRGGIDKRCQVELKTKNGYTLVIASLARDWREALNQALKRTVTVLTRRLKRANKPLRLRASTHHFSQD